MKINVKLACQQTIIAGINLIFVCWLKLLIDGNQSLDTIDTVTLHTFDAFHKVSWTVLTQDF